MNVMDTARTAATVVLTLAFVGCAQDADNDEPGSAGPLRECEIEEYPCTWADVDIDVGRRLDQMFDETIDRMYDESPTALLSWLRGLPDVVDSGVDGDSVAVWFRLEGGRRVYVMAPDETHAPGRVRRATRVAPRSAVPGGSVGPASGPNALEAGIGRPLTGWLRGSAGSGIAALLRSSARSARGPLDVAGRDRNEDTRVNQRDERRALVLDPLYFEFCYDSVEDRLESAEDKRNSRDQIIAICEGRASPATLGLTSQDLYEHGSRVAKHLETIEAYRGNVVLLKDQDADHSVIRTWNEYDVVHLASHGDAAVWAFGRLAPLPKGDVWNPPSEPGLHYAWSKAGNYGPKRAVYGVDRTWVSGALPEGLDRTLVFAAACKTQGRQDEPAPDMVAFLKGSSAGVIGWNAPVPWDYSSLISGELYDLLSRGWTGRQALDSLAGRRRAFLRGSESEGGQAYLLVDDLEYQGRDLRLFEVVSLIDPESSNPRVPGRRLRDGARLNALLAGSVGDEIEDTLTVDAEIIAITDDQVPETRLQLELDGTDLGSPISLEEGSKVGPNRYRLRFSELPVGKELEADTDYELEAVAYLPEGQESRYAVRLRDTEGCYWRVSYSGARSGEAEGRQVLHIYDGGVELPGGLANPRLTYTIGGVEPDVAAFTFDFGHEPLEVGTTGTFLLGTGPPDDYSDLDLSLPGVSSSWQNYMTGERRTFTVNILQNDETRLRGTFRGSLLNVPWRNPGRFGRPTVEHGDIRVEGEFDWKYPGCKS